MQRLRVPGWLSAMVIVYGCGYLATAQGEEIINSARSGPWSAAATWEGGRVPDAGARVLIKTGHAVTYDVKSDKVIRGITISGSLAFATNKDTELNVGLIRIEHREDYSEEC